MSQQLSCCDMCTFVTWWDHIRIMIIAKKIFIRFQLSAHKPFAPGLSFSADQWWDIDTDHLEPNKCPFPRLSGCSTATVNSHLNKQSSSWTLENIIVHSELEFRFHCNYCDEICIWVKKDISTEYGKGYLSITKYTVHCMVIWFIILDVVEQYMVCYNTFPCI